MFDIAIETFCRSVCALGPEAAEYPIVDNAAILGFPPPGSSASKARQPDSLASGLVDHIATGQRLGSQGVSPSSWPNGRE